MEKKQPKMTNLADWAVSMLTPWRDVVVTGACLSGDEIHRFRVMTKRLRAAWRMAESVDGVEGGEEACEDLRQLAKKFGGARDGDVILELVRHYVDERKSSLDPEFLEWMDARVREHFQIDGNAGQVDSWSEEAVVRAIGFWASQREHLDMRRSFMRGIGRTEERFRRRVKKALQTDREEDWHRCRRWAKYLYFQYSTLAELADEEISKSVKGLRVFASQLGKRNDLANLKSLIRAERKGSEFATILKDLRSWVNERDAAYEKATKDFVMRRFRK